MKITFIKYFLLVVATSFTVSILPSSAGSETANKIIKVEADDVLKEPFLSPHDLSIAKEKFYQRVKHQIIGLFIPVLIMLLIVFSGANKIILGLSKIISARNTLQLEMYILLLFLSFVILKLPYDIWLFKASAKPAEAERMIQVVAVGALRVWLFSSIAGTIISFPFMWIMRRKPRTWRRWVVCVGTVLLFIIFTIQSYSSFSIDSSFKPMGDSPLKTRLHAILQKAGKGSLPIYIKETPETERPGALNGFLIIPETQIVSQAICKM